MSPTAIVLYIYLLVCVPVFVLSASLAAHSHGKTGLKDVLLITFGWPYIVYRVVKGLIKDRS